MEQDEYCVAVVLDRDYGERITNVARRLHTWVVQSAANDAAVAALRREEPVYSPDSGVTTFTGPETAEGSFLTILGVVEEHHGAYSHDPPLSAIEIIGLEPSDSVRDELHSYGFRNVVPTETGFIARRGSP